MINLRCPHHGCPIDVPDDMLGARIRCPHCDQLLFVEPQHQHGADPQPDAQPHGMHPGMPPLAALLGIRAGRGHAWGESGPARANMTDLDWQALAAFEQVLYATAALKTAISFGIAAALFTLLLWIAAAQATTWDAEFPPGRLIQRLASVLILAVCFFLMAVGRDHLARVRLGRWVSVAAWCTLTVAVVLVATALFALEPLLQKGYGNNGVGPAVLAIPVLLVAACSAGRALQLVHRAHRQASPHAIQYRLVAALEYLQWMEQV